VSFIKIKGVSDIFPNFKGVYCNFPLIYIYIYIFIKWGRGDSNPGCCVGNKKKCALCLRLLM
jgi:hypothetical protein